MKEHQTDEQMDVTDSISTTLDHRLRQGELNNMVRILFHLVSLVLGSLCFVNKT